jgi:hypothetical protein
MMYICPKCGTGVAVEYKRVEERLIEVTGGGPLMNWYEGDLEKKITKAAKDGWRPFMPLSEHVMLLTREVEQ